MERTYKIGLSKGKRRVWIDGGPLAGAGFVGGASYHCVAAAGVITLSLAPIDGGAVRKVTGRPDGKPIVDIVGRTVDVALAPDVSRVRVAFHAGIITIKGE
jgi:hypothetical protein